MSRARAGLQPPPQDFTAPGLAARLSREAMIATVSNGRPGTAMASWSSRLDPTEIEAIVDFIRGRFMDSPTPTPAGPNPGEAIYARNCSVCHGERGAGAAWGRSSLRPPPRDFTSESAHRELTRERMIQSVAYGRPGTAMAAWDGRLSSTDIEAVVDYIRAAFLRDAPRAGRSVAAAADHRQHGHSAGKADMAAGLPDSLVGDARAGEAFYRQNCVVCHGLAGDGNGPRAYFIFPKPRNFSHPSARLSFNRPALFQAIKYGVVGREMPAWGKVLNDQQIANVTEFVFRRFIQQAGGPLPGVEPDHAGGSDAAAP